MRDSLKKCWNGTLEPRPPGSCRLLADDSTYTNHEWLTLAGNQIYSLYAQSLTILKLNNSVLATSDHFVGIRKRNLIPAVYRRRTRCMGRAAKSCTWKKQRQGVQHAYHSSSFVEGSRIRTLFCRYLCSTQCLRSLRQIEDLQKTVSGQKCR